MATIPIISKQVEGRLKLSSNFFQDWTAVQMAILVPGEVDLPWLGQSLEHKWMKIQGKVWDDSDRTLQTKCVDLKSVYSDGFSDNGQLNC